MKLSEHRAVVPAAADLRRQPVARASPALVLRCLLVSYGNGRQGWMQAAMEKGWIAVGHSVAEFALRDAASTRFHLALVDGQSVAGSSLQEEYEQLVEGLSHHRVPLVVMIGDEQDALAEIRARQQGVWLYLPGVVKNRVLDAVFDDARVAVEKMLGVAGAPAAATRPCMAKVKTADQEGSA